MRRLLSVFCLALHLFCYCLEEDKTPSFSHEVQVDFSGGPYAFDLENTPELDLLLSIDLENRGQDSTDESSSFSPCSSDVLCFGKLWKHLRELKEEGKLLQAIAERRMEIKTLKEHWKTRLDAEWVGRHAELYQEIEGVLQKGSLQRMKKGSGCAHLLTDESGLPRFIVKPVDGDILCLNNSKYYGNPLNEKEYRVRSAIPLYHSAQTDALAYECAVLLGFSWITPKTVIDVVTSDVFYDISDAIAEQEKEEFLRETGPIDREKLCSVQEYIKDSRELVEWYRFWSEKEFSEEAIARVIKQDDFENIHILIWIIYDNDAHAANIRVVRDADRHLSLKKVDNGLSFPEKNTHLLNTLSSLPNSEEKFSDRAKQLIATLPVHKILELIYRYEMKHSILAFLERVHFLKELAQRDISIREINLRMKLLQLPNGPELALSDLSEDRLKLFIKETTCQETSSQ